LEHQRFKIEKVVDTIHSNNEEASVCLEKLNGNLDQVISDLKEMDTIVEDIKIK
jgi:hypothetical protein